MKIVLLIKARGEIYDAFQAPILGAKRITIYTSEGSVMEGREVWALEVPTLEALANLMSEIPASTLSLMVGTREPMLALHIPPGYSTYRDDVA